MHQIKKYLSLIKFSHTIFAMPFAMIGFFLGVHQFSKTDVAYSISNQINYALGYRFLLVICAMVFARSSAMAFNRFLDRAFDAKNPRTAIREIPSGVITSKNALYFTVSCCIFFVITCYFINPLCFYLSFVALFVILFYSYTKRFTAWCHLVLGVGLSIAPIGAYLAVTGVFNLLPLLFSFIVLFWVSGFDIIYALQDELFDKENKLYSIPAWLGKKRGLFVSESLHFLAVVLVLCTGYYAGFSYWYWIGAVVFCGMLIFQHSIVKPNDLSRVNLAFMTANGIASVVFAFFVILDLVTNTHFTN